MSGRFNFGDEFATAEFSPCRTWRYLLRRRWGSGIAAGFILLNPSTADEQQDDPTIRRCIAYAKAWGFGGLVLGNLFGLRSTDPRGLRSVADPVGPGNNEALHTLCSEVFGQVTCGWGAHGAYMNRGAEVLELLRSWRVPPLALTVTKDGHPGHPLYLPARLRPVPLP